MTIAPSMSECDQPTVVTSQPSPTNNTIQTYGEVSNGSDRSIKDPEKQNSQMGNIVRDVAEVMMEDDIDDDNDERCHICDNLISSRCTYWKCRRLSCMNRITLCVRCYSNVDPPTLVLEHKAHMVQRN